jgi:drug/metabolite transporter (DMT)-like permease
MMTISLPLPPLKPSVLSHLALLMVAIIYGANYNIAKMVMFKYLNPSGFIVLRIGGAGLLFVLIWWLFYREKIERADIRKLIICSALGVAGNMLMFFKGLSLTTPVNASVLMLVSPVFVLIFSSIVFKTQPAWFHYFGILLSFTGAVVLIGGKNIHVGSDTFTGDLFIIGNAISYAFYLVYVKELLFKYKSMTVIALLFTFGFFMVLPFGLGDLQEASFSTFPATVWWAIVFVVLGTTFLAYLLNAWALQKTSSEIVGSYIYLQPIIASAIGVSLGQDVLTIGKIVAAMLIFGGVFLVSRKSKIKR